MHACVRARDGGARVPFPDATGVSPAFASPAFASPAPPTARILCRAATSPYPLKECTYADDGPAGPRVPGTVLTYPAGAADATSASTA